MKNIIKVSKIFVTAAVIACLVFNFGDNWFVNAEENIDDLNSQIEEAKQKVEDLKKEAAIYQKNIRLKQEEGVSLQNQIEILNNQIAKTKLEIEATEEETNKTELEIRSIELNVLEKEDEIENKKGDLGQIVKQIHYKKQTNVLEVFVLNDSISDFFNNIENTKSLSNDLNNSLNNVKILKQQLLIKKNDLDKKREELEKLRIQLELDKADLEGQLTYKEDLLAETQQSEDKFYNLYWQTKQEQENANSTIYSLEKEIRAKLEQDSDDGTKPQLTDSTLIWPVPKNKITATFHDPDYPFRYLFEHPGVDIRAAQGTTLTAAADGYVLKAKDAGMGYSYIAILHADGLSTVYGHVSKIYVAADEYVTKGEIIGLTGGMPGTPGAGNLSTGPHLHFEVRLNGIPVDPLLYLP